MFVSRRIARPYTGKMDLVMERTQRLAEIMSRHGANTRITRVVAGEGAGEIMSTPSMTQWRLAPPPPRQ